MPPAAEIPALAEDARFLAPDELGGAACIAVDGAAPANAVLAVCHWPDAGAPTWLGAPTATAMADLYLRLGAAGRTVSAVSNNHVDEDGMLAAWLLLTRPAADAPERARALAAAGAGDYADWTDPWAARIAIALMALTEPATSPIPAVRRAFTATGAKEPIGPLHRAVLPRIPRLLHDPEAFADLWRTRWSRVLADIVLLDTGVAWIEDHPALDLAIVRAPHALDEMAVHPRVPRGRVLMWPTDAPPVLTHRYETWVAFPRADMAPRLPLAGVAARLSALETAPGVRWRADEPTVPRARLRPVGRNTTPSISELEPGDVVRELERSRARAAEAAGNLGDVETSPGPGRIRPGR